MINANSIKMKFANRSVRYPAEAGAVIDVTAAPYGADPTGQSDCTDILVRILDDVLRPNIDGMKRVMDVLESADEDFVMDGSFENRREEGRIYGIFPDEVPPARIIYFPKGIYLVSDTICYSFDKLQNGSGSELNRCIRFQGEDRDQCVIKLEDHCPGFEYGNRKPVVSFMRGNNSNVSMSNYFRNLTIDIGIGNAGAVGLDFFCNNTGAVRDVRIISTDPNHRGQVGLGVLHGSLSCALFKNIEVDGFDIGFDFGQGGAMRNQSVMENLALRRQRVCGVRLIDAVIALCNVESVNRVPAVMVSGNIGHVHILNARLIGQDAAMAAIVHEMGVLFLRNVCCEGYGCAVSSVSQNSSEFTLVPETCVQEYSSHGWQTSNGDAFSRSLNMQINDCSPRWINDFDQWVHPGQFGAVADGIHDDSDAIQAALDSGKAVLYFQPGEYVFNRPMTVPATIQRINGMFAGIVAGAELKDMKGAGLFTINEDSEQPLVIEDVFSFERNYGYHRFVNHAARRTLVMRDIHLQACAAYRNSIPGSDVFLEGVMSTNGIFCNDYPQPCFHFIGQKVWARQLDPEYAKRKIINDGSDLVLIGYKTEGSGVSFHTLNQGRSEILSGILLFGGNNEVPCVLNEDSDVVFSGATMGLASNHRFPWPVGEICNGICSRIPDSAFPIRYRQQFTIPLYVGSLR